MIFSLCRESVSGSLTPRAILIGVPYDRACCFRYGTALAPDRMRKLSHVVPPFTDQGLPILSEQIVDLGNVSLPATLSELDIDNAFEVMKGEVHNLLEPYSSFFAREECSLYTLGGDHSVTIAVLTWLDRQIATEENIKILYLDAHPDLCHTLEGYHYSHACVFRRILDHTRITPADLLGIGIRSFEDQEVCFLRRWPHTCITAAEIFSSQWDQVIDRIRTFVAGCPLYISVDIDVLDPSAAPGTGICEAGGLTSRQAIELLRVLSTEENMIGMDIVEVSPPLDQSDITSFAGLKFLLECFPKDTMPPA